MTRRFHASSKFIHREKNLCLAGIHASRNHASRVNNYAWREDFMPRQNLHIARRFYSSLIVMHREKIHFSRKFTYRGKIFMPRKRTYLNKERAILIHWPRLHSVISHKNKHHGEHRRWQRKKHQYRISIYLFISTSSMEYIEDDIAKHKA